MEEVHNTSKLSKSNTQAREVEQQHPGPEQTAKDEGLEDELQIVEAVLPAVPRVPLGCSGGRSTSGA
ncbi:hypothetical protein KSF_101880 [Reticulibacter mediterranei]|uniref:Uncharacterized protein n=1 Tax=Reticulibacter mediterranei TaxID=2778369 RepID=A0A8J3J0L4_9CHLR|nr:hypothetical protein [Reticulibacter mediterranei]GHP00141.1 hypothetical protein KSF_101880 [Reticulibacter mediterranei]